MSKIKLHCNALYLECVACVRIGRVDAFRRKGHGFDSRSSRHVWTLGNPSLAVAYGASG